MARWWDNGKDKEGSTLIDALDSLWVSIHDPMRELIRDGESGIATDEATPNYLRRNGTTYVPRALEHQVSDIDRRGALLRDTVHRVVTQCEQEGITVEFTYIMSECIFNGNALLTINGSSHYDAVYGQTPAIVLEIVVAVGEDNPGTARHVQRMREISIQATAEGTSEHEYRDH